jgi:hypothetical protein
MTLHEASERLRQEFPDQYVEIQWLAVSCPGIPEINLNECMAYSERIGRHLPCTDLEDGIRAIKEALRRKEEKSTASYAVVPDVQPPDPTGENRASKQ